MKFRLGSFFVLIVGLGAIVGWLILGFQQEQVIEHRIAVFDQAKVAVGNLQPEIHQIILADPEFARRFADSKIPPVNHISGGSGESSESFDVAPNRSRSMEIEYHYRWSDVTGVYSPETELLIRIKGNYQENADAKLVLTIEHSDTELTQSAVKLIESKLADFDIQVTKVRAE